MPCNGDCNQGRECNCQSKMKLRFVEREIHIPIFVAPNISERKIIRVLQYWDIDAVYVDADRHVARGKWVDVPLEVEELDK